MGNATLNATRRPVGISVEVQSDYSRIRFSELRECFNIWTSVLKEKERLDQSEFDEVFGLLLGDAEGHFAVMSYGMLQYDYDPEPKCDAMSVFLSLAAIGRPPPRKQVAKRELLLRRITEIFYFLVRDDSPDSGIYKDGVKILVSKVFAGLCRLTGRPQPDAKLLFKVSKQISDQGKKSSSGKVTRKHILDWLVNSRDASLFYDTCIEEIVGRGFDEFSGEILSSALFQSDEADVVESSRVKSVEKGLLSRVLVRKLMTSSTWSHVIFLNSKSTCIDALRALQKHKLQQIPIFLTDEKENAPIFATDDDEELIQDMPFPQCIGIVDYKKLLISFLRVLSLNNVELPSEISEKENNDYNEVEEVRCAVKTENGASHANDETIEEVKSTEVDVDNSGKHPKQSHQASYQEVIRKISSDVKSIGKAWSKMILIEVLPIYSDAAAEISSSIESLGNLELMPHFVSKAVDALTEPFVEVLPEQPLYQILEILTHPQINNVPLMISAENPTFFADIIEDSKVFSYLNCRRHEVWGDILWATINRLGLIQTDFIQVNSNSTALVSFHKMAIDSPIPTIAVVNDEGVLISTLSVSDLSCLTKHFLEKAKVINAEFGDLLLPTIDFYSVPTLETVTTNTLLVDLFDLMVANKLRSLFVVDESRKPIGYVDIKNIFRLTLRLYEE